MKDSDVHKRCSVEIKSLPEGLIFKEIPNHLILVTRGEVIVEQCPSRVQRVHLDLGTYQIHWSGKCFITTEHWKIAGVVMQTENTTVHLGWNSWTLQNLDLPMIIRKLNTTISLPDKLANPKLIRLHLPLSPSSFTPFTYNPNNTYYLFLIVCLIPATVGVYFLIRMKRMKEDRMHGAPRMIEMNERKNGVGVNNTTQPFKLQFKTSVSDAGEANAIVV